jgi:hypothetical protein
MTERTNLSVAMIKSFLMYIRGIVPICRLQKGVVQNTIALTHVEWAEESVSYSVMGNIVFCPLTIPA